MSKHRLVRSIQYLIKQIELLLQLVTRQTVSLFVRARKVIAHRTGLENYGFVLPTVTMVMLAVVLLSTAILFRSFDRAEVARNVKINQATLAAATPALDRAKAKIEEIFNDSSLPRATPKDKAIYNVIGEKSDQKYKFPDEIALTIAYDLNGDKSIKANDDADPDDLKLEDNEERKTAWMFPVDTNSNGKYDTYTLYSILFSSPPRKDDGKFKRARKPIEARNPPMPEVESIPDRCENAFGSFYDIVGDSDWYKYDGTNLRKSFFVYAANVPITQEQLESIDDSNYEVGKAGISAIEYQQDRNRIPLSNNAVWFEDDLELGLVSDFRLNGRVLTNGNLMTRAGYNGPITFYQVSDPQSCFYEAENSKIIVGGNVADGDITDSVAKEGGRKEVVVHKYKQNATPILDDQINADNKTTTLIGGSLVGYDINAYNQRIGQMVEYALGKVPEAAPGKNCDQCGNLPDAIKDQYEKRADKGEDNRELLKEALKEYYRSITRRVPFQEGSTNDGETVNSYAPPDQWRNIADNKLTIKTGSEIAFLPTSAPELSNENEEKLIGDRISVGYGLAALSLDENDEEIKGPTIEDFDGEVFWNDPSATAPETTAFKEEKRNRETKIDFLPDLGATGRGLFWEKEAAKTPEKYENSGGLRVVTGAGIYLPKDYFTNGTANLDTLWERKDVWSDAMPVPLRIDPTDPNSEQRVTFPNTDYTPFLQMRATAVYHHTSGGGTPGPNTDQKPIACVSSYYDPTNATSAQNESVLPWNSASNGRSNNGIVYNYSPVSESDPRLTAQKDLTFPNRRYVNQPLKDALDTPAGERRLEHYSAIHAAQCALSIMDNPANFSTAIPHGAIKEAAFLDGREVKSLNRHPDPDSQLQIAELENLRPGTGTREGNLINTPVRYDLPLEQRQPLEIRVTDIDLSKLRGSAAEIGGEHLLPNSGVIYATRDDALPDVSAVSTAGDINNPEVTEELKSTSDFKLDPSRRPNGIRLINGTDISRTDANDGDIAQEKGLILASNLPVYIKAEEENGLFGFNLHKQPNGNSSREEFQEELQADWSNFYDRGDSDFNSSFACRSGQNGCSNGGDQWRPATVIADSITLLSRDWKDGYRDQGDYDMRNNLGNSKAQNFLTNGFLFNNFVTTAQWFDSNGWPKEDYMTSYLANGVTPIQRRVNDFPEYLMEVCEKFPVSECEPGDWYVNPDPLRATDSLGETFEESTDPNTIGSNQHRAGTTAVSAYDSNVNDSDPELTQYPRRVAFLRETQPPSPTYNLILDSKDFPVPIGIYDGNIQCYRYSEGNNYYYYYDNDGELERREYPSPLSCRNSEQPRLADQALWFQTTSTPDKPYLLATNTEDRATPTYSADQPLLLLRELDTPPTKEQPVLVPMLQIHSPAGKPGTDDNVVFGKKSQKDQAIQEKWLQVAAEGSDPTNTRQTNYNITIVAGNSPSRPEKDRSDNDQPEETGGGLHNFVRTLENWGDSDSKSSHPQRTITIKGNFIQTKQSKYATAPIQPTDKTGKTDAGLFYILDGGDKAKYRYEDGDQGFPYRGGAFSQRSPFYWPASRSWGFDVGLLSQTPDLFAQRFTAEPVKSPDEYVRNISSDDEWIRTLLCAKTQGNELALKGWVRPSEWCKANYLD